MSAHYRVYVDVIVNDTEELRKFALSRAMASGVTAESFAEGDHEGNDADLNVRYWLGWAFDAGTPDNCGFQIENSGVEDA